jgi:hypothetical protein
MHEHGLGHPDMILNPSLPHAPQRLMIRPFDGIVLDTPRAGLLRQRDLEQAFKPDQIEDGAAVLVDLNGIQMLTTQAAYEIVGKWLYELRLPQRDRIPVVAITADNLRILRTVHAALRDSRLIAYALVPEGAEVGADADHLAVIGSASKQDIVDLDYVREHGPTHGLEAAQAERFESLRKLGLLRRTSDGYTAPAVEDFTE